MKQLSLALACLLTFPFATELAKAHDGHGAEKLGVKVKELANSSKEWDGNQLPNYPEGQPEIKVLRIKIPAGVTLPWHYHPVINAAVVLEGSLKLYLKNGTTKTFGPGEALIEVVGTVHAGQALGSNDVDILVVLRARHANRPEELKNSGTQPMLPRSRLCFCERITGSMRPRLTSPRMVKRHAERDSP